MSIDADFSILMPFPLSCVKIQFSKHAVFIQINFCTSCRECRLVQPSICRERHKFTGLIEHYVMQHNGGRKLTCGSYLMGYDWLAIRCLVECLICRLLPASPVHMSRLVLRMRSVSRVLVICASVSSHCLFKQITHIVTTMLQVRYCSRIVGKYT
jgi:hypothetical protein